jgi:hypothetical protein
VRATGFENVGGGTLEVNQVSPSEDSDGSYDASVDPREDGRAVGRAACARDGTAAQSDLGVLLEVALRDWRTHFDRHQLAEALSHLLTILRGAG